MSRPVKTLLELHMVAEQLQETFERLVDEGETEVAEAVRNTAKVAMVAIGTLVKREAEKRRAVAEEPTNPGIAAS